MTSKKQKDFLKLYEPIHERFERFCRVRVYGKMDFQDLMNETLLVAYEKWNSLKSKDAFLYFLFGICIRILSNQSKKKRELELHGNNWGESMCDPNVNPEEKTDLHLLYVALEKLPDQQRESIILFEISGFSIKEISAMHNASESAVKQRLKRGREKLTEIMTYESSLKMVEPKL